MRSSWSPCTSSTGGRDLISAANLSGSASVAAAPACRNSRRSRAARVGAAQPDMQRHHGALAEADQRQRRRRQVAASELGVEEALEHRRRLADAGPALVGIAKGERETIAGRSAPGRTAPARAARRRRPRAAVLPGAADLDQVVAVGAVAVQEHDQLARRAERGSSRGPSSSAAITASALVLWAGSAQPRAA